MYNLDHTFQNKGLFPPRMITIKITILLYTTMDNDYY